MTSRAMLSPHSADRLRKLCGMLGSTHDYSYRIGGEYEGGHIPRECNPQEVDQAWRQAGNLVQWRVAPGPSPCEGQS